MCCVMGYTGHDLSAAKFKEYLLRTVMRGPDDQRVVEGPFGLMGFGRLAIMGLTPEGMQPFYRGADCVVCNGELYGFRFEKEDPEAPGLQVCLRLRLRDTCCRCITSTVWICSATWTPSSRLFCMIPARTG